MPQFKGIADFVFFFESIKERNRCVQDKSVSAFLDTVAGTAQREERFVSPVSRPQR
jgi:hypothetical protein